MCIGAALDEAVAGATSLGSLIDAHETFCSTLLHRMFLTRSTEHVAQPLSGVLAEVSVSYAEYVLFTLQYLYRVYLQR